MNRTGRGTSRRRAQSIAFSSASTLTTCAPRCGATEEVRRGGPGGGVWGPGPLLPQNPQGEKAGGGAIAGGDQGRGPVGGVQPPRRAARPPAVFPRETVFRSIPPLFDRLD